MRAVTFDPATDHFAVRDLPVPEPSPGEVRSRVEACGLNPVDAKIIYWVPGLDVAGVIDALGPGVDGWQPGGRILYHGNMFRPHGGFAVQFARNLGMDPIIATCSARNFDLVRQFGATEVLDYHEGAVGKRVRALTGGAGVPSTSTCF